MLKSKIRFSGKTNKKVRENKVFGCVCVLALMSDKTNSIVMSRHETSFKADTPHKDTSFLGMTTAEGVYFVKLFDGVGYRLSKLMVVQN
jgi:hypothetical protein